MMIEFADPKEWWLELSPTMREETIRQSQRCSLPSSRSTAYLNSVCLQGFLNWLREDSLEAVPWLEASDLLTVWELVNGTAVILGTTRIVLIPTEAIDDGELAVPQEWVDIPSWAGDYYLAVQVQPERGWLRIWGYTTHQELKARGIYDPSDRTYCLTGEQLTQDLNAFWVTVRLCAIVQTRSAIAPLPELSPVQAENLIQRLGNPSVTFPRLAVPFMLWGALLEQANWRHQLFQHRTGQGDDRQPIVRLQEWWQGNFAPAWQAIAAVVSPQQLTTAWRSEAIEPLMEFAVSRAKMLEFGTQSGTEAIAIIISIVAATESKTSIQLQICPVGDNRLLPNPVRVRLLDVAGDEIGQASAAVTEIIQLQFEADAGERFCVEVVSGEQRITEEFEV